VREHELTHPTSTNHAASRLDIPEIDMPFSRTDLQMSLVLESKQQDLELLILSIDSTSH